MNNGRRWKAKPVHQGYFSSDDEEDRVQIVYADQSTPHQPAARASRAVQPSQRVRPNKTQGVFRRAEDINPDQVANPSSGRDIHQPGPPPLGPSDQPAVPGGELWDSPLPAVQHVPSTSVHAQQQTAQPDNQQAADARATPQHLSHKQHKQVEAPTLAALRADLPPASTSAGRQQKQNPIPSGKHKWDEQQKPTSTHRNRAVKRSGYASPAARQPVFKIKDTPTSSGPANLAELLSTTRPHSRLRPDAPDAIVASDDEEAPPSAARPTAADPAPNGAGQPRTPLTGVQHMHWADQVAGQQQRDGEPGTEQNAPPSLAAGLSAQRQFIAALPPSPLQAQAHGRRPRTQRLQTTGQGLSGQLQRLLNRKQAQQGHGPAQVETLSVMVLSKQREAHLVKCKCTSSKPGLETIYVFFKSRSLGALIVEPGSTILLRQPWTMLEIPGCQHPVILGEPATP